MSVKAKCADQGGKEDDEEEDVNDVTSSSTCSSIDDVRGSQVRAQFEKLASVLRETNANLHTFEFMLGQYRQLAKISPFNVVHASGTGPHAGDGVIMEQLKQLSNAVDRMTSSSGQEDGETSTNTLAEIQSLRKQVENLQQANNTVQMLNNKVKELEGKLESKTIECEKYSSNIRRLQTEFDEEKRRRVALDHKLDSEQKAAKIVAQDITRYVESMKHLERKAEADLKEKKNMSDQIGDLQRKLTERNRAGHEDTMCRTCLERSNADMSGVESNVVVRAAEETAETVSNLRNQVKILQKEKLALEQKVALSHQMVPLARNNTSCLSNESILCQTCLDKSTAEVVTDVARSTQQVHASALKVSEELVFERQLRKEIEDEHAGCQSQIRDYQSQCFHLKSGLEALKSELEQWQTVSGSTSPAHLALPPSSTGIQHQDRASTDKNHVGLLKKTQLKLASVKAQRNTLMSAEGKAFEELTLARKQLTDTEESLDRLKAKSKTLLSRYREKKQSYNAATAKLRKIRHWLMELSSMCQNKEDNNRKILDHLGNQIEISGRLLATYLNVDHSQTSLKSGHNTTKKSLAIWFCDIQALASWTHTQLAALGARHWTGKEPGIRQQRNLGSDSSTKDTISELSHTLNSEVLSKNDAIVVAEAQDSIVKTQKDHFNTILTLIDQQQ